MTLDEVQKSIQDLREKVQAARELEYKQRSDAIVAARKRNQELAQKFVLNELPKYLSQARITSQGAYVRWRNHGGIDNYIHYIVEILGEGVTLVDGWKQIITTYDGEEQESYRMNVDSQVGQNLLSQVESDEYLLVLE